MLIATAISQYIPLYKRVSFGCSKRPTPHLKILRILCDGTRYRKNDHQDMHVICDSSTIVKKTNRSIPIRSKNAILRIDLRIIFSL